ncbi:MAG: glutamine synthetase type III, partial [Oscillospiraceae bacterium]|nr:glutamine synthetase type III [Oscillospiraceae bacterium]
KLGSIDTGVAILAPLKKDDSDRNRTSPFAFTGNKFEFRMLGSSQSVAFCNTVLNTAVAECFSKFADRIENSADIEKEVALIISDTMGKHGRVIFNGNNYTPEWVSEAAERGLPNLSTTLDAIESMIAPKNIGLFEKHGVFSEHECHARYEVLLENFCKVVNIEADTLLQMVRRQIYPAAVTVAGDAARSLNAMHTAGFENDGVRDYVGRLSELARGIYELCEELDFACWELPPEQECKKRAGAIQNTVRPIMKSLREKCDMLEVIMPADQWPLPTYTDLMHRV